MKVALSGMVSTVRYDDLLRAARTLRGVAHRTPVLTSRQADDIAGAHVFLQVRKLPARRGIQIPRRLQRDY